MAKPRKKWEPEHRYGGNPGSFFMPLPLGQATGYAFTKTKRKKKSK